MTLNETTKIRVALLAGVALLSLLAFFAALNHQLTDEALAATSTVNVGQTNGGGGDANEYNSAATTIAEGDTVDFDWFNGVHDATSYAGGDGTPDWKSPMMTSTGTYSRTFSTAGTYTFYCTIHASWADAAPGVIDANIAAGEMVGKIVVEAAAPTATDVPPTATDVPPTATDVPPTATDVPAAATPTETPAATATEVAPTETPGGPTTTAVPPTATDSPAEATPTATATATDAPPAATATGEPPTATPTNTPSGATATAQPPTETPAATDVPPTAMATEEPAATAQPPAATAQPTATQPAPPQQPRTVNVEAGNEWFGNPGFMGGSYEITINAGDTVQWNLVEGVHTVYECGANWSKANDCAGAAWNSDILQVGSIYSQRFAAAGTYNYLCTLHPLTMRGVITVVGSAPPNTSGPTTGGPGDSSPGPSTGLPNSGYGPLSQESARPDSLLGRAIFIAASVTALLAAALVWKEVAWGTRN